MGGTNYSHEAAEDLRSARAAMPAHVVDRQVFTSNAAGRIHESLDPKKVKNGIRESRDSAAHPESNAVIIGFDVTGSMGGIPKLFAVEKLPGLMKVLLTSGALPDPQILMAAVGDANSDQAPLQVGQFESGMEMDGDLTKIWLEGEGGGQSYESYDLLLYWASRHTALDCYLKRGKKGYLFLIGDEGYYPTTEARHVEEVIGDKLEADLPIRRVLADCQEKYEVFKICVATAGYPDGSLRVWKDLLGERAVLLQDPATVCEFIAAQVAAMEGHDHVAISAALKGAGLDAGALDQFSTALVRGAGGGALATGTVTGALAPSQAPVGATVRL